MIIIPSLRTNWLSWHMFYCFEHWLLINNILSLESSLVPRQHLHYYYNLEYFILCSSLMLEHLNELLSVSITSRLQLSSLTFVFTLTSILSDSYASNIFYLQSMQIHWNLLMALLIQNPNTSETLKLLLRPEHRYELLSITLWRTSR